MSDSIILQYIQQAADLATIKCMTAVAAAQVIRHISSLFSLVILPVDIKDNIVAIATNLFKHLTTFNQYAFVCGLVMVFYSNLQNFNYNLLLIV